MTRKRGKAAVIDALITSGGFGDFGGTEVKPRPIIEPPEAVEGGPFIEPAASELVADEVLSTELQTPVDTLEVVTRAIEAAPEKVKIAASTIDVKKLARDRGDLGPVQQIHRNVLVIDDMAEIPPFENGMVRLFVPCNLVKPWSLHDRQLIGEPDTSDIYESILSEGQEEACVARFNKEDNSIELIAGYRRYCAVLNTSSAYLLIDLYQDHHLTDKTAWIEMTRENNLDRKKCIPISAQVESDQNAIARGLFKNLSELSKAAGKAENWARQNKHLYDQIPEQIRNLCTKQQLASLTAPHYRKVGKLLKDGGKWRNDRIDTITEHWETISTQMEKFPLKQIETLLEARSSDVKALSNGAVKVRVDHNGNINLTVSRGLSHQQISALVKTVQSTIESL
jgi:hypothetical protein